MKLPIKHKFFEQIKSGEKQIEYRDAHITFVNQETKEQITKEIWKVSRKRTANISGIDAKDMKECFDDRYAIVFHLRDVMK